MGVLAAERIKLTSTRSPWWCSAIIVGLGIGLAALFAVLVRTTGDDPAAGLPTLDLTLATSGVTGFGVMVMMILAALTVTSEYRFGIIRTTFQAVPNRYAVLVTKAGLVGVYGAVLCTLVALGAIAVTKVIGGPDHTAAVTFDGQWRAFYGIPLYAFLGVVLAVGVGVLVRQSAAAISLIVLWSLLIEPLLSAFGSFGRNVAPFLPFNNITRFVTIGEIPGNWHWGVWGSLLYFTAFVAVVFGAALIYADRRDA